MASSWHIDAWRATRISAGPWRASRAETRASPGLRPGRPPRSVLAAPTRLPPSVVPISSSRRIEPDEGQFRPSPDNESFAICDKFAQSFLSGRASPRLRTVAHAQIDSWLMDMDGVLVHEEQPVPGAPEFIAALSANDLPFLVLTNNSIYTRR